ncbi:hypothetical protein AVEN_38136-1 [Araneus ventricosus]|uniref:Uncharacterized protein n=1 Tax=Araneus ventricosus TaxID=182803 RepID=A0A4Y2SFN6_ARAVE|nr:hypothetical protein AVEN_38136-1 [Araneus ventricosus]
MNLLFSTRREVDPNKTVLGSVLLRVFMTPKCPPLELPLVCLGTSLILLFGRISCHRPELPSSLSHLRYKTSSISCLQDSPEQFLAKMVDPPNLVSSRELA